MALVKPRVNPIIAFDAILGTTITFVASGGDQVVKNEIKILLNDESETLAYQNTVTSYELSHLIPSRVLENGQYYKIAVRTYDVIDNVSEWSNFQPFYCYSTPMLGFNITNNQAITDANFNAVLTYNQTEQEMVDYAVIQLFDANNILVRDSGYLYNPTLPPLTFTFPLTGLDNNKGYKIKGTVITVNGTETHTRSIPFRTEYEPITTENTLTATLDNCQGYVNLRSNVVKNFEGVPNPNPPIYIDDEKVDLISAVADIEDELASWVKWDGALNLPKNFLFRLWFYPARQPLQIARFDNALDTEYLSIIFNRGSDTDYLSIRTASGTVIDHNLHTICNGYTKVFLWLKIVDDTWDVRTEILDTASTTIVWNNTNVNNSPYNVTSNVTYDTEAYGSFTPSTSVYHEIGDTLNNLTIGNGIFEELNITTNTGVPYSVVVPDYDDDTVLSISFNGNLRNKAPYYTKLILRRRDITTPTWLNLSEINLNIPNREYCVDFNDAFIPTKVKQTYALITYIDGVECEYYTIDITPHWNKVFISDRNTRFVLNYGVIYSNNSQNIQTGVLMPIGATYPVVIQNANGNYRSGSVQFKVLGYQYEIDKRLDRESIVKQLNDILAFLTNGTPKCITDFNGNVIICKVINSPQISYDSNWGNGIATVSFDWVEQGKYNDYQSMLDIGLFDLIGE